MKRLPLQLEQLEARRLLAALAVPLPAATVAGDRIPAQASSAAPLEAQVDGAGQPAGSAAAGERALFLARGDFTGAGHRDVLAIAQAPDGAALVVHVLADDGHGAFQARPAITIGPGQAPLTVGQLTSDLSVVVGDLTGDGRVDLLTVSRSAGAASLAVNVLLGAGPGGFLAPSPLTVTPGRGPATLNNAGTQLTVLAGRFLADDPLDLMTFGYTRGSSILAINVLGSGEAGFHAGVALPPSAVASEPAHTQTTQAQQPAPLEDEPPAPAAQGLAVRIASETDRAVPADAHSPAAPGEPDREPAAPVHFTLMLDVGAGEQSGRVPALVVRINLAAPHNSAGAGPASGSDLAAPFAVLVDLVWIDLGSPGGGTNGPALATPNCPAFDPGSLLAAARAVLADRPAPLTAPVVPGEAASGSLLSEAGEALPEALLVDLARRAGCPETAPQGAAGPAPSLPPAAGQETLVVPAAAAPPLPGFQAGENGAPALDETTTASIATPSEHPAPRRETASLAEGTGALPPLLGTAASLGSLKSAGSAGADGALTLPGSDSRLLVAEMVQRFTEAFTRLVQQFYRQFLGRAAAEGEEQAWVQMLLQGHGEESVLGALLGTTEFYQGAAGLVEQGTPDERYVRGLYQVLLGRPASAAEVSGWLGALPTLGRDGVATFLLRSQEYRVGQVGQLFRACWGREGTAEELNAWASSPLDLRAIRQAFEKAPEAAAQTGNGGADGGSRAQAS